MLCGAAGWVNSYLKRLWCAESMLQVDHSLDLHLFSSWFLFIWILQDQALQIRKWMKSLIRALNGILETFVCTWGSMYAEIKQQPLLACFPCSYNLSSRLCFHTVNFSLLYIYVFIYLYSETLCVHMEFWGVIIAMFSPAMPLVILPHQSSEGIWACCLPCSGPLLVNAAVVRGFSGSLLTYLGVLWPILDVSEGHGKSWWRPLLSSPGVQPYHSSGAHPRYLMAQLMSQAMLLLPSKQDLPIS